MDKNKRIGIFIENPTVLGGVQTVTKSLINLLKSEYKIPILISLFGEADSSVVNYGTKVIKLDRLDYFELNKVVQCYQLDYLIVQVESIKRALIVNQYLLNSSCKVLNNLHSSPYVYFRKYGGLKRILSNPRLLLQYIKMQLYWKPFHYRAFESITSTSGMICVSEKAAIELKEILNHKYDKQIFSIHNPLTFIPHGISSNKQNRVVYAGRLSYEKRPLLMLDVWNKVQNQVSAEWHLDILGEGPERSKMIDYIERHHIKNVHFHGVVNNVNDYLEVSKIAILFSYYEGLPTVMLEAASFCNALLATKGYGGTSDIVINGETGILCDATTNDLCHAMLSLMNNDELRYRLSQNAYDSLNYYNNENILNKWKEMLSNK